MPVDYGFKRGIDLPAWVWLTQCPVSSTVSAATKYDGKRYIYVVQSASLYRYDTWSDGWQFLGTPTTGGAGQDMVFDQVRNVLIIMHGLSLTSWQVFNLNMVAVTIAGVVCPPLALTTMTTVLPAAAATGANLSMPRSPDIGVIVRLGIAGPTNQTVTNVEASVEIFYAQLVGLTLRVTSGLQLGQKRIISAVPATNDVTLAPALPGALASGDTFVIEYPSAIATAGTITTLTDAVQTWTTNKYASWDVEITAGTGIGQRRRIASNTATVLTLAAAVAGNPRTGDWATAPAADSQYRIIPSTDYLYFITGTTFRRLDVLATTPAWATLTAPPAALGAGGGLEFSRGLSLGHLFMLRGSATNTIYVYDIGLNTWVTVSILPAISTFTTGASLVSMSGIGKLLIYNELSTRLLMYDLATGNLDVFGNHPYIAGTAVEGKRLEEVITLDGVRFVYLLRPGGQEFFRVAAEWL